MRIRPATPADSAAIAHIHVVGWQIIYRGIVPDAHLDALRESDRIALWDSETARVATNPSQFICVAETDAGEVGAFAAGGPERLSTPDFPGELYAIYILPDHRRQGHGRQLMRHSARHLLAHSMPAMLLWALQRNPACHFYEAVRGQRLTERTEHISGAKLIEVAYGLRDLALLAGSDMAAL